MKKSKLKRLKLPIAWIDGLIDTWESFLLEIFNAMRKNLSMYDPERRLKIFTDTSEGYWSELMTQTITQEDSLHTVKKKYFPLLMLSASFAVRQVKCT
eukprot:snap_masked-scaffold_97-processed-gene-0.17-mRNA-1 protein AED:0.99 eAED:1.00 QI:0/-1/0/1/-1/1/1/0/97